MNRLLKKVLCIIEIITMIVSISFTIPIIAEAKDKTYNLTGSFYNFIADDDYEIDSSYSLFSTKTIQTLGSLSLSGDVTKEYNTNDLPAYEIAEGSIFSLTYKYNYHYKNADKTDWHLTTDSGKKINRSELPDKINNGAIILQTSLDGNKWINSSIHTDISSDIVFEQNSGINEIQLANGCFYRIIVAYMVEKSEEGHFDFTDVFNTALPFSEYKRYAEVYTFFAKYNENDNIVSGKKFYYNTLENTKSTTENNYVGSKSITFDNPHYGWELGSFCISGYTDTGDTNDIYLKNVGNKIRLSYKLEQDINRLNGNSDLIIANDINGSDGIFQINPHNMEHGELLIKHTDEEGIPHITEYSNYLEALTSPNADTTIQLFEEGDYEIHLDYAITDQSGIRDKTTYYRTSFSFKIRNSNCMIFLFDSKTGNELSNGDVTEV